MTLSISREAPLNPEIIQDLANYGIFLSNSADRVQICYNKRSKKIEVFEVVPMSEKIKEIDPNEHPNFLKDLHLKDIDYIIRPLKAEEEQEKTEPVKKEPTKKKTTPKKPVAKKTTSKKTTSKKTPSKSPNRRKTA